MNTAKLMVYEFNVHDRSLTDTSSVSLIVGRAIVTIRLSSPVMNNASPVITRSATLPGGSAGPLGAGFPAGVCTAAASCMPSTIDRCGECLFISRIGDCAKCPLEHL